MATAEMYVDLEAARWTAGKEAACSDLVAVERPLEIVINTESLTVTMRTPGADADLAAGLLFAEGLVASPCELGAISDDRASESAGDVLNVHVAADWKARRGAAAIERSFVATSSCGMCGKTRLESVNCTADPVPSSGMRVAAPVLQALPDTLRGAQDVFNRTGGLHAAALFDTSGGLITAREDIGRHNAVDKVIGAEFMAGRVPLTDRILLVSGRASYEIVQKAAVARIPVVCAVSAPSSMAVSLAREKNITLVAFLRPGAMNVYTARERITP